MKSMGKDNIYEKNYFNTNYYILYNDVRLQEK